MSGSSDHVPSLPECVQAAVDKAEHLYSAVLTTPFPDLSDEPSGPELAIPLVATAIRWARTIQTSHDAVVRLFPVREEGIEVELVMPGSHLLGGHPTLLGGGYKRGYVPPPPRRGYGQIIYRTLKLDIASDVIEPVPLRLQQSLVGAFPFNGPSLQLESPESIQRFLKPRVEEVWKKGGWECIRRSLAEARLVVRWKSLGLVAWVRSGADELRSATLPTIKWVRSRTYGGHVVNVALAGATREAELTKSEHDFLLHLATGAANASRTTKADLANKLPELAPYIDSEGAASPKTSRYAIPPAMAQRIRVTPDNPATWRAHHGRHKTSESSGLGASEGS